MQYTWWQFYGKRGAQFGVVGVLTVCGGAVRRSYGMQEAGQPPDKPACQKSVRMATISLPLLNAALVRYGVSVSACLLGMWSLFKRIHESLNSEN